MFAAGAGALGIAALFGWFWAYAAMGLLMIVGIATFLIIAEPAGREKEAATSLSVFRQFQDAVVNPFRDFMTRPGWLLILIFIPAYKLGEAMAGAMAKPFYIDLGFSLGEIAAASSAVAFATTILGGFIGGIVVARFGLIRALLVCGIAQSAGNLFYVLLDFSGHNTAILALSAAAEDVTGGMAGTALVAFASRLSRPPYTATQYALLASVMALGRSFFTASGGKLSLELGWTPFFLLTTVITLPALGMLHWIGKRWPKRAGES
jgi:MFS transporter, PAT family, beta-lactamase induction signal transducer AmpG